MEAGVSVYGCRRCSAETSERTECSAAARPETGGTFKPYQKPLGTAPWGNLIPGSTEYAQAMNEWVSEYSQKKRINVNKAFCEAKRQGWQPELYNMDDDLREELELAGLLNTEQKQPLAQPEPIESGISLDEIIKNMQEDSK
jgi:hypothetical protein